jgi:hypothetical protein
MTNTIQPSKPTAHSDQVHERGGADIGVLGRRQGEAADVNSSVSLYAGNLATAKPAVDTCGDSSLDSPTQHRVVQEFIREQAFSRVGDAQSDCDIGVLRSDPDHYDVNNILNNPYAVTASPWALCEDGLYRPSPPSTKEAREVMRLWMPADRRSRR